jgi:hypothetical protein
MRSVSGPKLSRSAVRSPSQHCPTHSRRNPKTEVATAAPASPVAEKTLPATASTMPLIGLLGLMALGGAFAVRAVASRLQ